MIRIARAVVLSGLLVVAPRAGADVTETTPYPYDHPPAPGAERGTFAFNGSGAAGPNCYVSVLGTAKFLPDADGSGGKSCVKFNVELSGSGPACAAAPFLEGELGVRSGTYTYNGDGTMCERVKLSIGPFKELESMFHNYIGPDGNWLLVTNADIAYPCPGALPPGSVDVGPNGVSVRTIGSVVSYKIGAAGDDPPGSGQLPCELP